MVSRRCTPLAFLLTGFSWLLLAALAGTATLLGLVYGTPLPSWLRTVHVHAVLIGGILQLALGGVLASISHTEERPNHALTYPLLYFGFNSATTALLVCLASGQLQLAGIAGLVLTAIVASSVNPAWHHIRETLVTITSPPWVHAVMLSALFIGMLIGTGMAFGWMPEYRGHIRLLHLHIPLFGFFTVLGLIVTQATLPSILQTRWPSPRLNHVMMALMTIGLAALVAGFAASSVTVQLASGCIVLLAAGVHAFSQFQIRQASSAAATAASDHLFLSTIFLLLMSMAGLFMAVNFLSEKPWLPIGSLHLAAYAHLAFLGFMVNVACAAMSCGLPVYLAAGQVPNRKKRLPYLGQLEHVMNRWRGLQLAGLSFGTMALATAGVLTWSTPLGALPVRIATWSAAGLLLGGLTIVAAKLVQVAGSRPTSIHSDRHGT